MLVVDKMTVQGYRMAEVLELCVAQLQNVRQTLGEFGNKELAPFEAETQATELLTKIARDGFPWSDDG
tara:strand:+ start:338 stop:541 length:204 start_codon:yes stop_codon:yes gene_type:complete